MGTNKRQINLWVARNEEGQLDFCRDQIKREMLIYEQGISQWLKAFMFDFGGVIYHHHLCPGWRRGVGL